MEVAVKKTGYVRNLLASSLRTGKTGIIGIIMPLDMNSTVFAALYGLEKTIRDEGYQPFFVNTGESPSLEKQTLTYFIQRGVEGVVISSTGVSAAYYRKNLSDTPVVCFIRTIRGLDTDAVTIDAKEGIESATQYLINLGHTNICFLHGPSWLRTARARLRAFRTSTTP